MTMAARHMHLRLFFAYGSNSSERVRWALAFKGIEYEAIDVDALPDASEFDLVSPFGRVPVLVVGHIPISESMAIVEFLEEIAPEPALLPSEALDRARVREVCEAVNASIHPGQNSGALQSIRPDWTKEVMCQFRARWIRDNLEKLAPRLWHSSEFVVGEKFTLADIFVAAIYRKGEALAGSEYMPKRFRKHWEFLMAQAEISASYPVQAEARTMMPKSSSESPGTKAT